MYKGEGKAKGRAGPAEELIIKQKLVRKERERAEESRTKASRHKAKAIVREGGTPKSDSSVAECTL